MIKEIYERAYDVLKSVYGEAAQFREGQYEAIEAMLTNKRTLVVQKTGWGKSLVYFISTRLAQGITIVISPLLVLMENQRMAADKIGLRCLALNSNVRNEEERLEILRKLQGGECDLFFTTPETLYRQEIQEILPNLNIGLFVVDECHCISDWGHDFRLEYGKLNRVIARLPENVSVLGTTATANDRVIEDLKKQFGDHVFVSRGPLTRETLHMQILKLETKAERYAWIRENINRLPGSGIIYCLTRRDCQELADFLNRENISARAYYSDETLNRLNSETGMSANEETEYLFMDNRIKVIVATIKLGMGYDKEDIGFVIHFQRPSSLVAYYQQIGRAGRKEGSEAYCYMMTGKEDREINDFFVEEAFPTEEQERAVIAALEHNPGGLTKSKIQEYSNISSKALDKSSMFLMNQGIIYQDASKKFFRSANPYVYMGEYYEEVKRVKRQELDAMEQYADEQGCLSKYVVNSLNDNSAAACGKCANCLGHGILPEIIVPSHEIIESIQEMLGSVYIPIIPRKRWPDPENPFDRNTMIAEEDQNQEGLALSKYGDAGYGEMVAYDKYHSDTFREELVTKAAAVLREKLDGKGYTAVTNIPSGRNAKVRIFAEQLAAKLGYQYAELLEVTGAGEQQKKMQNRYFQYKNAAEKLKLKDGAEVPANIILVDAMVDSGWTLTVGGRLLMLAGAGKVYPFCLADSSNSEG